MKEHGWFEKALNVWWEFVDWLCAGYSDNKWVVSIVEVILLFNLMYLFVFLSVLLVKVFRSFL